MTRTGLDALFDPTSVAVVGASANPEKWGYWLASGALEGRARRTVHLVNRRGGELHGVPFLPGLDGLPDPPEHVVVAVPPRQVRPLVAEGLVAGARCFTVITSGAASADEERELAALVTGGGARLLGPNCMGVVDTTTALRLSWGDFPAGAVGLVSQSGNLALEIGRLLARAGQGFSRFVSLGNQRDIDAADALDALIAHGPTRIVAAYVEDFRDGRRLARTLTAAHAAGKPVLLLTVGRSEASGRAAASHTGALVSARATVEAVCRDAGALLLDTAGELVDTAICLLAAPARGSAPRPPVEGVLRDASPSGNGPPVAAAPGGRHTVTAEAAALSHHVRHMREARGGPGNASDAEKERAASGEARDRAEADGRRRLSKPDARQDASSDARDTPNTGPGTANTSDRPDHAGPGTRDAAPEASETHSQPRTAGPVTEADGSRQLSDADPQRAASGEARGRAGANGRLDAAGPRTRNAATEAGETHSQPRTASPVTDADGRRRPGLGSQARVLPAGGRGGPLSTGNAQGAEADPGGGRRRRLRVAVVGDSGGQGALAADALVALGIDVPGLSAGTSREVAAHLAPGAACGNPVDLAGAGEADLANYARIARALLFGGDADAVVLTGYFGDYATSNPAQAEEECEVALELAAAARESGRQLVVHTMARDSPALAVLRAHAVPVYERIEQAATALAGTARLRAAVVAAPAASPVPASFAVPDGGYETVRELLASYGLTFPVAGFVTTADEAADAAHRTGYPLALKAMGLAHKTEAGGVALGIADEERLRATFARMRSTTGAARYAVEAMASPPYAVELIAGVRRDPAFGPVAMVGIGGVTAELLADTAVALAPLTPGRARALLLSLRHAPLLTGWRGSPPVHLDAAAAALCALAQAGAEHPELSELEVNPLLVHPGGAIALDAHGVLR
ncbi:acetate--CoA ligase family protein [Streptomyces sp. NPDC002994]|uniref:acetate--CoA ligase family protein n=1 Tax=Streptomyces sp. NPDC002994 TaxID=3154441 RepID=UPI0033B3ADE7